MNVDLPTVDGCEITLGPPAKPSELLELIAAGQQRYPGSVTVTEELVRTILSDPSSNHATDHLQVRDVGTGALVAWAMFENSDPWVRSRTRVSVSPDAMGMGIGTALTAWGLARARADLPLADPNTRVTNGCSPLTGNVVAQALLVEAGYHLDRYFLEMTIAIDESTPGTTIRDGFILRTITDGDPIEVIADTQHEAFRDHYGWIDRPEETRHEEWNHWRASDLWENELVWLVERDSNTVAMLTALDSYGPNPEIGYIAVLGVLPQERGQGLAKALLTTAFSEFQARGKKKVVLHVDADSLTGATRLYEAVGMKETERQASYEIELRPGEDIVVRQVDGNA